MMMMMRTLMLEEAMGSPAEVPFHAYMYLDFPLFFSLPCLGILLSFCHTNIPHSAYAELHKQSSTKSPLQTHACAGTCLHAPAYTHRAASQACFVVLSADPASHGMVMCDSWR